MNLKDNISEYIDEECKAALNLAGNNWARLAIIKIGKDEASELYIKSKMNMASKWHIDCDVYRIGDYDSENALTNALRLIDHLNNVVSVNGIIVQLPVPFSKEDTQKLIDAIRPSKNVDGFTQTHDGEFSHFYPCTPFGIINFLKWKYDNVFYRKNVVVIGRGKTVGEPLVKMLLHEPYNKLTICASNTNQENLEGILADADIVISAVPVPEFINPANLKTNVIMIDAGIAPCPKEDRIIQVGNLAHNEELDENRIDYTPWTNGVGKLTVATLMSNVRKARRM